MREDIKRDFEQAIRASEEAESMMKEWPVRSGHKPYDCDYIPISFEELPKEVREQASGNQFSGIYKDNNGTIYSRMPVYQWRIVKPLP